MIIQGAQYYLPVTLTHDCEGEITDQNCDDVKIRLDDTTYIASNGDVIYGEYDVGEETRYGWLIPLTQEQTLALEGVAVPIQAQVKIGSEIFPTPVSRVNIGEAIIREVWT